VSPPGQDWGIISPRRVIAARAPKDRHWRGRGVEVGGREERKGEGTLEKYWRLKLPWHALDSG
jgi:hypothetical protein